MLFYLAEALVWEQVQAGQQVEIWTICAGAPGPGEPLSAFALSCTQRWQTEQEAVSTRQTEDRGCRSAAWAQGRAIGICRTAFTAAFRMAPGW